MPLSSRIRLAAKALVLTALACGPTAPAPADTDPSATTTSDDGRATQSSGASQSDDRPGDPTDDPRWDLPPAIDASGGDETGRDPIPCLELDPSRAYLRGTLVQGEMTMDALADPTDPTVFCVGFEAKGTIAIRATDGHVVFVDDDEGGGVLEFMPDTIAVDPKGEWIYPDDPYANDTLLLPWHCDPSSQASMLVSPIDGRPWLGCGGSWLDPDGVPTWTSAAAHGVAIASDGRLLVHDPELAEPLQLLTPGERPTSSLALPRPVEAVVTGRVHDDGLWLVAIDGLRIFRWQLVGDTIVEEGEYGDTDAEIHFAYHHDGVLDADGDFVHFASEPGNAENDLILRRRLAPATTEIIYAEADVGATAVKVYFSTLFTGP